MTNTTDGDFFRACVLEVERCRDALARGSSPDFWRKRLAALETRLADATAIVRAQLNSIGPGDVEPPTVDLSPGRDRRRDG